MPIRAPRVNDERVDPATGEPQKFGSKGLPAYARRSPKVTEALAVLCLHGLWTGDFEPALRDLLGEDASGLSAASISRLTNACQAEHEQSAPAASPARPSRTGSGSATSTRTRQTRRSPPALRQATIHNS